MKTQPKLIIYTSVDGTLLDGQTHSFAAALPALRLARERGVPIVLCSSRTQEELEEIQRNLCLYDPFIIENGGAILIPEGYFPTRLKGVVKEGVVKESGLLEIELGESYQRLVKALRRINRELPFEVRGFSDLSIAELVATTGMTRAEAKRAKAREFDEPFTASSHSQSDLLQLREKVAEAGLRLTRRGSFFHLHSDAHKGVAVRVLSGLYRHFYRRIQTVGLGSDLNDLPMLNAVDVPIVMRNPDGEIAESWQRILKNLRIAETPGPQGWNQEVLKILTESAKLPPGANSPVSRKIQTETAAER